MRLGGFEPFTASDFPGRPAAIVFSQGCNFRCPFCHNGTLLGQRPAAELLSSRDFFAFLETRQGLLGGVVVSGGEPTLQEALPGFCRHLKEMGFAVKLDTNGSRPQVIHDLIEGQLVDFIAMDIKAPLARYELLAGKAGAAENISSAIALIAGSGVPHHFRTTHVRPLLTDEDLRAVLELVPPGSAHRVQPFISASAFDSTLRQAL
ncbi:MAG: anaerobic ribonucleoside-triphosphate reductase activating protein [Proteobacteria bacterium]|jgi:pyruvate formate lyase activating enzyme|nr:anaerobic ribonucleoside-triphosphate reductase activating protein [Pseudomonadota bacterium]